jgi:hypothetical protein
MAFSATTSRLGGSASFAMSGNRPLILIPLGIFLFSPLSLAPQVPSGRTG